MSSNFKVLALILTFLLIINPILAHEDHALTAYQAEYKIVEDTIIVTEIITLEEPTEDLHWHIPVDATAIEVKGLSFETQKYSDYKTLIINTPKTEVTIKYISSSSLETNKDNFFILELSNIKTENKQLTLILPEAATLKHPIGSPITSIIPKTEGIKTDGKHIIITWGSKILKDNTAILTIFNSKSKDYTPLIITLFVILLIALWLSKGKKQRKHTTKAKAIAPEDTQPGTTQKPQASELTRNLFQEEKQIVELLLAEPSKELWQKQLEIKTKLSKVKLFRKLRNLVQKDLIEKIPHGNTNKIRLKTPSK